MAYVPTPAHRGKGLENGSVPGRYPWIQEVQTTQAILAGLMSSSLASAAATSAGVGMLKSANGNTDSCGVWCDEVLPRKTFGSGGMIYSMDGIDTTNMTKFTMTMFIVGWAYAIQGATSTVALIILMIYCIFVLTHLFYLIRSQTASSCWDSVAEITVLAMQSRPSAYLENTSAGIAYTGVYSRIARAADIDGRVEITFEDDDRGTTVRPNTLYR